MRLEQARGGTRMNGDGFRIDVSEAFEHFPNAPIVEAVIHWRARAETKLEPAAVLETLRAKLGDYPHLQWQQEIGVETELHSEGAQVRAHEAWHGFRFESGDRLQVAQFNHNGFVFSRLKPYRDWLQFQAEGQRLWSLYREFAEPSEIQRLGVRFINVIPVELSDVSQVLTLPPRSPDVMALPIKGFLHQTKFNIPDHPYELSLVQTIQPPAPAERELHRLILDLDVGTTRPIQCDEMEKCLQEMRWIKNKAFFSLLTSAARERFRSDET